MELEITHAQITRNTMVLGQTITNKMEIVGMFTATVAEKLGAEYLLFDKERTVRAGFKGVELDALFTSAAVKHGIEKISMLELASCEVSKFKAMRLGDGKKKPKRIMVKFEVKYAGAPFVLVEHLLKVGRGEGVCRIVALTQDTIPGMGKKVEIAKKGDQIKFGDATAVYPHGGKDVKAALYVIDGANGYSYTAEAVCGPARLKKGAAVGPVPSEAEALANAAEMVLVALKPMLKARGTNPTLKAKAVNLQDWLVEFIQGVPVVAVMKDEAGKEQVQ